MLTSETLSTDALYLALSRSLPVSVVSPGILKVTVVDRECMVVQIGPLVRLVALSTVDLPPSFGRTQQLELLNRLNADLSLSATAYLSDEDQLCFSHVLSTGGGLDEGYLVVAVHEFVIVAVLLEQLIVKEAQ